MLSLRIFICCLFSALVVATDKCFLKALNAASIEAREEIHATFEQKSLPFIKTEGCVSTSYSYPSPSGHLEEIFARRLITFGYLEGEAFQKRFQDFAFAIVKRINTHYQQSVTVRVVSYNLQVDIMNALKNGEIDATLPTVVSVPFLTEQVRGEQFLSTCSLESLEINFFTSKSSNINTMKQLSERLADNMTVNNKIACSTEGELSILNSLFVNYPIEVNPSATVVPDLGCIAMFASSKNTTDTSLSLVKGNIVLPVRMFIRGKTSTKKASIFIIKRAHHQGNLILRSSFDRAIAKVQTESAESFSSVMTNNDMLSFFDCAPATLSSPNKQSIGTLKNIIKRGTIKIGYSPLVASPLINTENFDEESDLINLENKFVLEVSQILNLNSPLGVERVLFRDADAVLNALDNGSIDATSMTFLLGGYVGRRQRVEEFSASCVPLSWKVRLWFDLKTHSEITSFGDIALLIARSYTLIVSNEGMANVARDLFGDGVETKIVSSLVDAFTMLHNDNKYAAYLGDYLCRSPVHELSLDSVSVEFAVPVTMFFRFDTDSSYFVIAFILLLCLLFIFLFLLLCLLCYKRICGTKAASKPKSFSNKKTEMVTQKPLLSETETKIDF